jgi:hypothetical protein
VGTSKHAASKRWLLRLYWRLAGVRGEAPHGASLCDYSACACGSTTHACWCVCKLYGDERLLSVCSTKVQGAQPIVTEACHGLVSLGAVSTQAPHIGVGVAWLCVHVFMRTW